MRTLFTVQFRSETIAFVYVNEWVTTYLIEYDQKSKLHFPRTCSRKPKMLCFLVKK